MAKHTTSRRRQLIVAGLLAASAIGAVMRHVYPPTSAAYDLGTLLLVMWVPAVGNIIAFAVRKWRESRPAPPVFDDAAPFVPQLQVEFTLDRALPGPRVILVVGQEAFSARASRCGTALPPGGPEVLQLQLLRPEVALPKLVPGTAFRVLLLRTVIGKGRVLGPAGAETSTPPSTP